MSREVVILSAARTPVGRYLGTLADIPAFKLGAIAIAEAVKRAGIDGTDVEEVIMGNVLHRRSGPEPRPQGRARRRSSPGDPGLDAQHRVRLGHEGVHEAAEAIKSRRRRGDRGRRHGEHEHGSVPDPQGPPGLSHGRRRPAGRDDPGRSAVRHEQLPHGHHRGERGREVRHHPRDAGPDRLRQPAEGRRRHRSTASSRPRSCRSRSRSARATPSSSTPTSTSVPRPRSKGSAS